MRALILEQTLRWPDKERGSRIGGGDYLPARLKTDVTNIRAGCKAL